MSRRLYGIHTKVNPKKVNKKWEDRNEEKVRYLRDKSTSRSFTKKMAAEEGLQGLEQFISDKRLEIEKEWNIL